MNAGNLTVELFGISRGRGFISSTPGADFDARGYHIRARQIGALLDQVGGLQVMRAAAEELRRTCGDLASGELACIWDGVGDWKW